jgi:ribonuclease P protein subunit POP4
LVYNQIINTASRIHIQNQRFKLTSSDPFIPAYIKSTITNSSDPVGIYASRIQGRPILLENPARESKAKKERAEKKARHQLNQDWKGVGVIVKRRAKEKGVWRFDKTQAK